MPTQRAGKRKRASHDWFWFCFWLDDMEWRSGVNFFEAIPYKCGIAMWVTVDAQVRTALTEKINFGLITLDTLKSHSNSRKLLLFHLVYSELVCFSNPYFFVDKEMPVKEIVRSQWKHSSLPCCSKFARREARMYILF